LKRIQKVINLFMIANIKRNRSSLFLEIQIQGIKRFFLLLNCIDYSPFLSFFSIILRVLLNNLSSFLTILDSYVHFLWKYINGNILYAIRAHVVC
jgi:hypothetical protein